MIDSLVGQVLATRYRVEERIGAGAMGTVFRATHVKVGRPFAIKVLHPRFVSDPKLARRFDREAEIAGTLRHPNVISVVDAGETPDGLRYLVMEFVDGISLTTLMADAPLPAPRVLRIAQQLCDGLQHAHERGLIHRDFKPDNVIVERDNYDREVPRIVDFGIALLGENQSSSTQDRLTTAGMVLGTPHYMAPEHARGDVIDHRIDLFALGVILYEMLTGQPPFDGDGVDVARANLTCPTPPMGVRVPNLDVDPLLEAITRKLMNKAPSDRPATAQATRELLDLIESDRTAAALALDVDPEQDVRLGKLRQARGSNSPVEPMLPPATLVALSETLLQASIVEEAPPRTKPWLAISIVLAAFAMVTMIVIVATRRSPEQALVDITVEPTADFRRPREVEHEVRRDEVTIPVPPEAPVPNKTIAKQVRPTPPPPIADPTPTPQEIADLYVAVGRELKKLELDLPDADPLWTSYRRIKLHEAMATPETRRAALRRLSEIRTKISKR